MMQKHPALTLQRLQRFAAFLPILIYPEKTPLNLTVYSAPGRISFGEAMQGEFHPTQIGEKFGPLWSTHWFHVSGNVPEAWRGREVHLLWDSSTEATAWQDGAPVQGLTGSYSSWQNEAIRKEFPLLMNQGNNQSQGGETVDLFVEIACNGLFGLDYKDANPHLGELVQADLAIYDREAADLFWDFRVVADMARHLPSNTPRAGQALYAANAMVNAFLPDDRTSWAKAREIAGEFFAARNGDGQHNLSAVGHAHIDTAWLWPLAETKRKSARSFSSAVRYMDAYPEYKFACSQAQQYEWMKENYPGLYTKIKEKVKSGQFIPAGGTWVEPDCNLPSGESLVRQFLFGQRFFRQEFGKTCGEFWNPDVFGYSGALPQIMRLAGIEYFLTQKLSWNQFNKPASHTFLWEGIDGSRVLTHFPPADNYNATCTVKELLYNVSNFKDHDRAKESYFLFGWGDGGGGPTIEMLEQLRRVRDVDGLPRVEIRSPQEFFARCAADVKDPTVWVGELYFELHRGTYTTQARNKKANRRTEFLLHNIEFLSALGHALYRAPYPAAELDWLWKRTLTNQFHDIIPGSSIHEVYEDSAEEYKEIEQRGNVLRSYALNRLQPQPAGPQLLAFNTLGVSRMEVVELPEGIPGGQTAANGKTLGLAVAPAAGYSVSKPGTQTDAPVMVTQTNEGFVLENAFLRAEFTPGGRLASLVHKHTGRESIPAGSVGNRFVIYDDQPIQWEAWDVDAFHLEKPLSIPEAHQARVTEMGPLRAVLEFDTAISEQSILTQRALLAAESRILEFDTIVDWHEQKKFLKVEFPLDVRAANATYEIQFGHLQRPTHFNTTWDLARFEVPAHKWADLSEPGFGVSLLNDCKYGYAAHGNVLRLSLLRAPTYPDATADQGRHTFRYALLPHNGDWRSAGVVAEAYRFNVPLLLAATSGTPEIISFFSVDNPAVILDTVKKAEDSDALIVRLYEAHGSRGTVRLSSPLPVQSATACNLLEEDDQPLAWANSGVTLNVTPFQIVTIKLTVN